MTNDARTPEEIEREIEEQRSDLTSNLEDLQDRFSLDTVVRQIGDQFRDHGGDIGRSVARQVKENPIPLALTGIGLAWMIFGNSETKNRDNSTSRVDRYRSNYDRSHSVHDTSHHETDFRETQMRRGQPYTQPTSRISTYDTGPSWARRDDDDDGYGIAEKASSAASSAKRSAISGAQAVKDGAASAVDAATGPAHAAAGSVSSAASAAGSSVSRGAIAARDGASSAAGSVQDGAAAVGGKVSDAASAAKSGIGSGAAAIASSVSALGSRITEGTDTLTAEGKQRVIAARRKAIEMRDRTSRSMSSGMDATSDFYDRQPLVVGALALAVGAALGGALPRTRTEDDLLGQRSDDLFNQAERILAEEQQKAMSVAKSVQQEVKDIASETKADLDSGAPGQKSAVDAVGDKAKAVAGRVAGKAKSKAKSEGLGKPKVSKG